ncbi:MAG TPA: YeeE/YedE thiosulfate transporter family protein [Planctomycetota bacterium]|nr:YeeE/YedE thiosulfate transporter family protein [Planctomycetota bacterium]HRR79382.1 YeeE/YedE thiosulfate transporter family protein [Planctomycetota bacterium]HRT93719.1 YeeE/YedE thiosulfate transporter family protein [Planctomycetota bacterium]
MRVMACLLMLALLWGMAGPAMAKGAPAPLADGTEVEWAPPTASSSNPLTMARWSPYVVGVGIGVLCCLAFLLSDKTMGCSTAFARSAGMLERLFRGKAVEAKPYYQQFKPVVDWEWMLVVGLLLGAAASALLSGTFHLHWVPPLWAERVGVDPVVRWVVAFFGGICMGFGARWAGGCTSGHGISGTLQLAASGWLAVAGFFIGGIATAVALFHIILA